MTTKRVPLIKDGHFKFVFPNYDALSQEVKDIISEIFTTEQFNIEHSIYLDLDTGLPIVYTDEETGISVYYPGIYQNSYVFTSEDDYFYINFFDEEENPYVEKMLQPVFETNLMHWVLSDADNDTWERVVLCPINVEFYVNGVLTPLANYRQVISYVGYGYSIADFPLAIKETQEKEFPDVIPWSYLKEIAKKGYLLFFNMPTNNSALYNQCFQEFFLENAQYDSSTGTYIQDFIEAVYIPYNSEPDNIGDSCKYVRLKDFNLFYNDYSGRLQLFYSDGSEVDDRHYYILVNPQNLTLMDQPIQLVTGKLSFNTLNVHNGGGGDPFEYYNFYHFAVDNCGLHVFNDVNDTKTPPFEIYKSYPEHQIHDVIFSLYGSFSYEEGYYRYLNLGSVFVYYNAAASSNHGFGCFIDGVEYKILGIKSMSSNYDGYVSEAHFNEYFDPDSSSDWQEFYTIANYDNHGHGSTSQTTVTAWVIPMPEPVPDPGM